MKLFRLILLTFLFFPQLVLAYTNPGTPTGYVNDFAQMLDPAVATKLNGDLVNFEAETKHEIAVVTIPSLAGDTIENYAVKLFEDLKIGKKGADNGVLFLIVKDDRQMRIEVGYGLEGALPDATANKIISSITKPAFRSGDYDSGVVDSVNAIEEAVKGEDVSGLLSTSANSKSNFGDNYLAYIIIFGLALLQVVASFFSQSKAWWPGGVWGAVIGFVIGVFLFGFAINLIIMIVLFGLGGLGLDYFSSKHGPFKNGPGGRGPWFWGGGGFGGGSGGGFGGFGGGGSGGGGSSGSW